MSYLSNLESLLNTNTETFLKSLYVDDSIDFYTNPDKPTVIPIIRDRNLTTSEPDDLAYIRKFTKDNIEYLKEEMCVNKTGLIVQYIRAEKNEIRLLGLYLRLRDNG